VQQGLVSIEGQPKLIPEIVSMFKKHTDGFKLVPDNTNDIHILTLLCIELSSNGKLFSKILKNFDCRIWLLERAFHLLWYQFWVSL